MLEGFRQLVLKELKDLLRDPKILVGMVLAPLLVFPLVGFLFSAAMEASESSARELKLAVVDLDRSLLSERLVLALASTPGVEVVAKRSVSEVLQAVSEGSLDVSAALVIPEGFGAALSEGRKGEVEVYAVLGGLGVSEAARQGALLDLFKEVSRSLAAEVVRERGLDLDPEMLLEPLKLEYFAVVEGRVERVDPRGLVGFLGASAATPWIVFVLVILAAQIAATSVAVEKEYRTLEMLLTLPVSRLAILASKLAGPAIIALIGSLLYAVGYKFYMDVAYAAILQQGGLEGLTLEIPPQNYVVVAITFFLALLLVLALSATIAVFTQDVRSAQALAGNVIAPLALVPSFLLMFADPEVLPPGLRLLVYVLPFSYPALAVREAYRGFGPDVYAGIAYMAASTFVVLYIAARVFSTERVLTARLAFRGRAERREES